MPLYEFKCLACSGITEKQLPMTSDVQNIMCEKCGEHTAKRIISRNTFILKGGGWSTQYRENTTAGQDDEPYKPSTPWVEPK